MTRDSRASAVEVNILFFTCSVATAARGGAPLGGGKRSVPPVAAPCGGDDRSTAIVKTRTGTKSSRQ